MKPTLVVLAAGIGSRYGSLKQMDSFGPAGETIIEFSVYDALLSGFERIVFVISRAMEKDFSESFVKRFPAHVAIDYVIQEMEDLPEGFHVPEGRAKPWGTAHAVMAARHVVKEPFAIINGDDFYGRTSFQLVSDFLSQVGANENHFCMAGYSIRQTLSEHGTVSRGLCEVDENLFVTSIIERTKIGFTPSKEIAYQDETGQQVLVEGDPFVSMNIFGFTPAFFHWLQEYFVIFLRETGPDLKSEYFLPYILNKLIKEKKVTLKVLPTPEKWFGVTYKEDKPFVTQMLKELTSRGVYPSPLWKGNM